MDCNKTPNDYFGRTGNESMSAMNKVIIRMYVSSEFLIQHKTNPYSFPRHVTARIDAFLEFDTKYNTHTLKDVYFIHVFSTSSIQS